LGRTEGDRTFWKAKFRIETTFEPGTAHIPAFDRFAVLFNRHLNPNREYAYANDIEVRLRALTDLAKEKRLDCTGLIYEMRQMFVYVLQRTIYMAVSVCWEAGA